MPRYEYRAIPAPRTGERTKDTRTTPDRFALALTQAMNRMAAEGWEYLRADSLPCEERFGLTGRRTTLQYMLVFRRGLPEAAAVPAPAAAPVLALAPAAEDWPAPAVRAALAPTGAARAAVPHAPVALPEADPMDDAARRAGVIPAVARPVFGAAPRIGAPPRRGAQAARAFQTDDSAD